MKRVTIRKGMLEKHIYTEGCPGCTAVRQGKQRYTHIYECRRVLREQVAKDEA